MDPDVMRSDVVNSVNGQAFPATGRNELTYTQAARVWWGRGHDSQVYSSANAPLGPPILSTRHFSTVEGKTSRRTKQWALSLKNTHLGRGLLERARACTDTSVLEIIVPIVSATPNNSDDPAPVSKGKGCLTSL
eukprot:248337-Rhodomonas_salina.2